MFSKFKGRRFGIMVFLLVTVTILTSCSKPSSTFTPLTPKNPSALSDAILWAKSEYNSIDENMTIAIEYVDFGIYKELFQIANSLYKSGEYENAKTVYENILAECPVHLGARNNYVLALVHCGEYEDALKNSILLGFIHPSYDGNWVNILIPLYALGYDNASYARDLRGAGFPDADSLNSNKDYESNHDYISEAYAYNRVYADMEAQIGEKELNVKLAEYKSILQSLRDKSPNDTDYSELMTYFEGLQKIRSK